MTAVVDRMIDDARRVQTVGSTERRHEEPHQINTIVETATRLRVSRTTVYELIRSGDLKSIRIGGRRMITDSQINKYIEQLTTPS